MIPAKAMIQMKTAAETGTDFEQSILYTVIYQMFRDLRVEISSDLFLLYRKLLHYIVPQKKFLAFIKNIYGAAGADKLTKKFC